MGKYASKDTDSGLVVTWGNVTGKPLSFPPSSHDNAAHSVAYITSAALSPYATITSLSDYAPLANPTFTGIVSLPAVGSTVFEIGTGDGADYSTYNAIMKGWWGLAMYNPTVGGTYPNAVTGVYDFREGMWDTKSYPNVNGKTIRGFGFANPLSKVCIDGGLHVGGESDAGDNNILADGSITGASLNTPNWTFDEDEYNNLIVKYQGIPAGKILVPVAGKSNLLMTGGTGCNQSL